MVSSVGRNPSDGTGSKVLRSEVLALHLKIYELHKSAAHSGMLTEE